MLSWPGSVESITTLNTWSQFACIFFMILAAVCIFLLISASRETINILSEKASSSSSKKQSIQNTAGSIRKEMLKAKQDNDIARMRITSLEAENSDLRIKLIKSKKNLEDLEDQIKNLEVEHLETQDTLEEKATIAFSTEQQKLLIQILENGPKGHIDIFSVIGENSSHMLAEVLEKLLGNDGWTTNGVVATTYPTIPEGIILAVHSKETAPSYSSFLQRSLTTIGLSVSAKTNKKYREWSLTMIVGRIDESVCISH